MTTATATTMTTATATTTTATATTTTTAKTNAGVLRFAQNDKRWWLASVGGWQGWVDDRRGGLG
jgi:hypothetical protein